MIGQLQAHLEEPTSRGLTRAVISAIRAGHLAEGDKLPPIRVLATSLQISPTTVSAAWALLIRAGAIRTDGRRGTVVCGVHAAGPKRYRRALEHTADFELDLSTGIADPQLLPSLKSALRSVPLRSTPNTYLDDAVLPQLEELLRADWPYQPERISVVDGAMDAQDQIASLLLRFGDLVAVEHPCFPASLDLLESMDARLVGIAVDENGMIASELAAAVEAGARIVFLQPRAQNPTGVSMSRERMRQLSKVLAGTEVIVVEDDSAGAISSSPMISLASYLPQQTIHIRSFSKSHGPDLRLAAMSGPAELIDRIIDRRYLGQGWTSRLLQAVLLDLLARDSSVQQVAHARETYAQRRAAFVTALDKQGVRVGGSDGLNIWLPVQDETAALIRLASRGIGVAAGSPFATKTPDTPHLRVTTSLISQNYDRLAEEFAEAAAIGTSVGPR